MFPRQVLVMRRLTVGGPAPQMVRGHAGPQLLPVLTSEDRFHQPQGHGRFALLTGTSRILGCYVSYLLSFEFYVSRDVLYGDVRPAYPADSYEPFPYLHLECP